MDLNTDFELLFGVLAKLLALIAIWVACRCRSKKGEFPSSSFMAWSITVDIKFPMSDQTALLPIYNGIRQPCCSCVRIREKLLFLDVNDMRRVSGDSCWSSKSDVSLPERVMVKS